MSAHTTDDHLNHERLATIKLANVGAGPSSLSLSDLAIDEDTDAIVLLCQRDYHCRQCRQQVKDVAARYDEFESVNAVVVSVLPEPAERARQWQDSYDLPFPLLADPQTEVGDTADQPTRFGRLGQTFDLVGRMPEAIVFNTTDGDLNPVFVHRGTSPGDRPSVNTLLEQVRGM